MKRKTHEEYVDELSEKYPNVIVLGSYINAATPILHKCAFDGYEWYSKPNRILTGHGCPMCAGNARKTHSRYVEEVAQIDSNIEVIGSYKSSHTSILHRCIIDGYEWYAKPNNILNGRGCPKCAGTMKKTHSEYVYEVSLKNLDVEVIGEYIGANTPILHRCRKHNIQWNISPSNVLQGYGCNLCRSAKKHDKLSKEHKQYVNELQNINGDIVVVDSYINSCTAILHRCMKDGHEWYARPGNILKSKGCPLCAGNIKKTHDEYVRDVFALNPDIEVVGEYINANTPIKHKCLKHNLVWEAKPANILNGSGCPYCNESIGERRIRQWLEKNGIKYVYQKTFADCRDVKLLPFDFYLPDKNAIIEYDGKQHYEVVDFFGGQNGFDKIVMHDSIKDNYCKSNNITLLRIPYNKNIEQELNNFIYLT